MTAHSASIKRIFTYDTTNLKISAGMQQTQPHNIWISCIPIKNMEEAEDLLRKRKQVAASGVET